MATALALPTNQPFRRRSVTRASWGSSGGGGGGNASQQAQALRDPGNVSADTPVNPMQQEAYGAAKKYGDELGTLGNEEITRELGRYRDEISVGMEKEGEAAMSRGADPTLFRGRALDAGRRGMHALQGKLADVALGRRAEAVGLQTGAAGAAAGEQRLMHLGSMSQRLAENRALTEQAETQSRLYEAPYDRLMKMFQTVASNRAALGGSYDTSDVGILGGSGGGGVFANTGGVWRGGYGGGRPPSSIPQFRSMVPML